jgi:hypothetical protein
VDSIGRYWTFPPCARVIASRVFRCVSEGSILVRENGSRPPRDLDIWAKLATVLIAIAGVTPCPTGFWSDRPAGDIGGTSFGGILLRLDVYNFGMAWPEIAQFKAYSSGIPFVVEVLLPLAIGRPPAITAIIPTRDPPVGSDRSVMRYGIAHSFLSKSMLSL